MAIPAEELSKLAAKSQAFQKGLGGVSLVDFETWMDDKWVLPYGIKLQALFHDAIKKTNVLGAYNGACLRFSALDLSKVVRSNLGPDQPCITTLIGLVNDLRIELPGGGDFDPMEIVLLQPSSAVAGGKDRKKLFKSQIKASVSLLKAATALLNYLSDLAASGPQTEANLNFRFLVSCDFYKSAKGLPDGHCHLSIHKTLYERVAVMKPRRD
ncbi:MAG TPA: hypothetical protein VLJ19_17960 [Variovorax sp.]|nr:hypothetical protein [Variovorax sp.]